MSIGTLEERAELLGRAKAGDERALETIYARLKGPLFGLAYRYTANATIAEDLLQDIFLKIFSHLDDVDRPETFESWAYRIALNTCFSHLREIKATRGKAVPLADVEGVLSGGEGDGSSADIRKPLAEAISGLSEGLRAVFLLHDLQGFKHGEIARALGCSVGTSKSQLFKARMKLRDALARKQAV
ncbi:MAG: RNA polymerase sigma factor [Candidatus Aminicenantes bacterium]|nr:RNA polymerase sigma factor [Candidatus Aminicenantes bacterium]